jgi:PAS domain S-box-containing protein
MDLHPGAEQCHQPEIKRAELDPILRFLQENEDWYQDLVEHSQDLLCIHNLEGKLLSINPAPARALGYSVEELLQIPMREIVVPESRHQFDTYLDEIKRTGHAHGLVPLMTRSGERRVWRYYNTLRTDGVDDPIVRGIAHDVTEQMRTEQELREVGETVLAEAREKDSTIRTLKLFRALVDQSNDAIEVVNPVNMRFLDVNEKACSGLGYSRRELLSLSVFDIDPAITQDSVLKILDELQKLGSLVIESVHRRKDGTTFPVEVSIKRVHLERDYLLAVARDLSEQKRAEAALREREKTQKLILDQLPVGVVLSSVGAERALYHNPKFVELFGYTIEECPTVSDWWPLAYPDPAYRDSISQEWHRRMTAAAQNEGEIDPMEVTITCRDGSVKHVRVLAKVIGDLNFISFIDLTNRKQAEEKSRESEERYRAVYEHAPIGICRVESATGKFLGANTKYCEIVGRTEQELLTLNFQSITHPDDLVINCEKLRQLREGELQHCKAEKRYLRPDGAVRCVEVEVVGMCEAGAKPAWHMAIVQDVTERKQAEERLREFERVVENLEEMAVVVDRNYRYTVANKAFLRYWSVTEEQVVGHSVAEVIHHDLFQGIAKNKLDACFKGEVVKFELAIAYPELGLRDIALTYSPVEGPTGFERAACIMRDITEQKRAEQALTESEARERSRSKELETVLEAVPVAVCIAHDVDCQKITGNRAAYEQLGVELGSNISQNAIEGDRPAFRVLENGEEVPPQLLPIQQSAVTGKPMYHRALTLLLQDGSRKETIANVMPLLDEKGQSRGAVAASIDVTELRMAGEALRQNVARLQAVTEELRQAKEKLSEEKIYLEQAIDAELGFGEIIGRSPALKSVMQQVAKVAHSDATVLIMGETGTGKELIARAIHRGSRRQDNSFIKLNCAAIPSGLLESELFGHEKGAFTGAITKKLGRLELADQGTLFLDEIGEIPLELQPKLLRVLQDREFERLGGTQTLHVDFRLIAATNRDLRLAVNQREFRSDLYYRLNVFPIRTPPLRERREDIPPLVEHFVRKYASRMAKSITSILRKPWKPWSSGRGRETFGSWRTSWNAPSFLLQERYCKSK